MLWVASPKTVLNMQMCVAKVAISISWVMDGSRLPCSRNPFVCGYKPSTIVCLYYYMYYKLACTCKIPCNFVASLLLATCVHDRLRYLHKGREMKLRLFFFRFIRTYRFAVHDDNSTRTSWLDSAGWGHQFRTWSPIRCHRLVYINLAVRDGLVADYKSLSWSGNCTRTGRTKANYRNSCTVVVLRSLFAVCLVHLFRLSPVPIYWSHKRLLTSRMPLWNADNSIRIKRIGERRKRKKLVRTTAVVNWSGNDLCESIVRSFAICFHLAL